MTSIVPIQSEPPAGPPPQGTVAQTVNDEACSAISPAGGNCSWPPPVVPDHELLRIIGQGAYGEVWLARNVIGTLRAIKVVYRRTFEKSEHFEREFKGLQRFEPISRLHEGLVDILQIGRNQEEGYFYYVMELADNGASHGYSPLTLRHRLRTSGSLSFADCVTLGVQLATALEYLHHQDLVHRDVKPSNIIFVNGQPKLADIGLVANIDEARSMVGTPGYIPPEGPGSPKADVYSLGKVLYEAAFGKDRQEFPQMPADLESRADYNGLLELNEIILKACESDPAARYRSAEQVSADLHLIQTGKSVRRAHNQAKWSRLLLRGLMWLASATAVVSLISLALRSEHRTTVPSLEKLSTNDEANRDFDLGRAQLERGTNIQMGVDYLTKSIQADSKFAEAYTYLGLAYSWSASGWNPGWVFLPKAKTFAEQAHKLKPSLALPHLSLGWYYALHEWDWSKAEQEYDLALTLGPQEAYCHRSHAEFLKVIGRTGEAVSEMREAGRLVDRRWGWVNMRLIAMLIADRKFDEAIRESDFAIEMDPQASDPYGMRVTALSAQGRYPEAIEAERRERVLDGEAEDKVDRDVAGLKSSFTARGPFAFWEWELQQAINAREGPYWQAHACAQIDKERAVALLQKAFNERDPMLTFHVMTDFGIDPVRADPRVQAILHAMHLE